MDSSRIFVRNLPPNLSESDFRAHFSKQASTTDTKFIPQRRIGYVGYKTPADAAKAVKYHNKSFIRMSRIGVEIARTIDEQYALNPGVKRKRGSIQDGEVNNVPQQAENTTENDIKKAGKNSDKLEEFLKVMQPPSKVRVWEDQAALVHQTSPDLETASQVHEVSMVPADENYQPVLKQLKESINDAHTVQHGSQSTRTEDDLPKDLGSEVKTENEDMAVAAEIKGAESDADWLRSRTSRLLGLVDDDPMSETSAMPDNAKAQNFETLETPNGAKGKASGLKTEGEEDTQEAHVVQTEMPSPKEDDSQVHTTAENGRLFIRNLTYTTTEDELRCLFENERYGSLEELHLPIDSRSGQNKGFAHIRFARAEAAAQALSDLDQTTFQGRLLHVMPANPKKEHSLDEFAISKLPLKKQQQIRRKAEAATSSFNWNSMYMNADAIMSSVSDRLGVSKSELLDPTSSDTAIKQAHAETHIIQETKKYFSNNGINLDAFKRKERGETAILVKNFSYGTKSEELKKLFEPHGHITRILLPPSGTIAIIEFDGPDSARSAFSSLAYRKFKDSVLFLEKAPKDMFKKAVDHEEQTKPSLKATKASAKDLLERDVLPGSVDTSTLFVQNLNFVTTTERLRDVFKPLKGFLSARVKTKHDPKKPGHILSMGFGFLEFGSKEDASAAFAAMDGFSLDNHILRIRASHRVTDAAEERRKDDQAKRDASKKTKIIIKNLPFEASRKDVRSLFGAYGQLRSVRVPKKFDSSTRGFAFADFVTTREAENAMDALRDTHLLGRRLVLDFAAEDALDPEQEIEKMQQKVGKQADKVALQRLTGSARKKFNVEGDELDPT